MTYTYAVLEVSREAYEEIAAALAAASYHHAFHDGLIDMHGIALKDKGPREPATFAGSTPSVIMVDETGAVTPHVRGPIREG